MSNTTLLLISIAVIMIAAIPTAMVLKDFLPGYLERSSKLDQLENRIYALHAEGHEIQDRVNALVSQRNAHSSERHRAEGEIRKMEKTIAELASQPPLFVHEVGDPKAGMSKYTVNIVQEKASSQARASGERAPVNMIWRYANVAEVWAATYEEAKQLVETAFPFKMGFLKTFVMRKERKVEEAAPEETGEDAATVAAGPPDLPRRPAMRAAAEVERAAT